VVSDAYACAAEEVVSDAYAALAAVLVPAVKGIFANTCLLPEQYLCLSGLLTVTHTAQWNRNVTLK
jgi:hypothetical protein